MRGGEKAGKFRLFNTKHVRLPLLFLDVKAKPDKTVDGLMSMYEGLTCQALFLEKIVATVPRHSRQEYRYFVLACLLILGAHLGIIFLISTGGFRPFLSLKIVSQGFVSEKHERGTPWSSNILRAYIGHWLLFVADLLVHSSVIVQDLSYIEGAPHKPQTYLTCSYQKFAQVVLHASFANPFPLQTIPEACIKLVHFGTHRGVVTVVST